MLRRNRSEGEPDHEPGGCRALRTLRLAAGAMTACGTSRPDLKTGRKRPAESMPSEGQLSTLSVSKAAGPLTAKSGHCTCPDWRCDVGQKPSWRSVAGRPERDTLDATQAELRDETLRRNGCSAGRACLARCNSSAPFAARWESAEGRLKGRDFLLQAQTDATIGTMPRQKQRPPNPKGPD